MRKRKLSGLFWAFTIMIAAGLVSAATLKVDIGQEPRADMKTPGWENWFPDRESYTRDFGDLSITLRATGSGELGTFQNKPLLVKGLSAANDGVSAESGGIEIEIRGLAAGSHSFVGYHHLPGGRVNSGYDLSTQGQSVRGVHPTNDIDHDDDMGSSYIKFTASAGQPVVVRIAAAGSGRVVLNAFAIGTPNPKNVALKPSPAHLERHADGDDGKIKLSWTPAESAVSQHLYMVSDRDLEAAMKKLASVSGEGEGYLAKLQGGSYSVPIEPNNSLLHYAWRVDTVDAQGNVTQGSPWQFRVRHLAFPGAEGYGRFAIGGRGGRVMHVTNLNDSGPGSLREAVEATGPRTVVFDVSGLISLESRLVFKTENEFLTVAGQTAPGKGITLRGHTFGGMGGKDTIVRFVRMRMGDLVGGRDGMGLASSDHCIIDHCSISWTIDEAFSSRGAKNITFQRNIISEALNGSNHGFAASIGGDVGSFHHSLLAHNAGRNWSLAGSVDQANVHAGRLDIRNIVVYNWHHRTTDGGARQVNFVANYYKPGPASEKMVYLNPQFEHPAFGPQQYYVEGNILEGVNEPEGPEGPFVGMSQQGSQEAPVTVSKPFFEPYVETHTAREAYENVLADVGCNVPMYDDHDKRILREVRTGTTTYKGSKSGLPGIPDTQGDVGGWEDYPEIHRPADWDTDRDGMPNKWEIQRGLNPNDPSDGAQDPDGDGYTNLEDYLNWLAAGNSPDSI